MKVYIGPYKYYLGPYQIADFLKNFCILERDRDKIGDWLADTWVNTLCEWVDSKRSRSIAIKIDRYDTWSMDHTLALIIPPMLKQLKATKHGAPYIDNEDVPEHLHTPPDFDRSRGDVDANHFKRCDYIFDEMIYAFEEIARDDHYATLPNGKFDWDTIKLIEARIKNGCRLFGKYYQSLWD